MRVRPDQHPVDHAACPRGHRRPRVSPCHVLNLSRPGGRPHRAEGHLAPRISLREYASRLISGGAAKKPGSLSPRARPVRHGHDKIATRRKEPQMQYALLIYSKPGAAEALSADEREATTASTWTSRSCPRWWGAPPCIRSRPPPRSASRTGRRSSPTARSRTPRRSSAALPGRGRRPGPGDRDRGADPGRADRRLGGDPARRHRPRVTGAGTDRADLPRRVGPGAGLPHRLLRRFRPGRGGHRRGVRGRGQRWPDTGTPDNPGAWLVTTARHRAIDRLRRDRVLAAKLPLLAEPDRVDPRRTPWTARRSRTSGSSSSSCAAIRRWPSRRRWR